MPNYWVYTPEINDDTNLVEDFISHAAAAKWYVRMCSKRFTEVLVLVRRDRKKGYRAYIVKKLVLGGYKAERIRSRHTTP